MELGKTRLSVEADLIKRYIIASKQVNGASAKPIQLGNINIPVNTPQLEAMELSSYEAADLIKDGVTAISSGVLTGLGANGLIGSFGVASTGTAISTLSGAAATNATLAWLGGGSLASGGLGVAGGTAVLGGVIAGPAIAIMGLVAAKKSETALTEAFVKEAEIKIATSQVNNGIAVLLAIDERVNELQEAINSIAERFEKNLTNVEKILIQKNKTLNQLETESKNKRSEYAKKNIFIRIWNKITNKIPDFSYADPFNYNNFSEDQKKQYTILTCFGYALYSTLKVKILDDDGILTPDSEKVIAESKSILLEA